MPGCPNPLDTMLAKWPFLYPEITGTGGQGDARTGDADRVREEVLRPLLEATDINSAYAERQRPTKGQGRNPC